MFERVAPHRRSFFLFGTLLICLFLLALSVPLLTAQEAQTTHAFASADASLTYDETWSLAANDDGTVSLTSGDILVTFYASSFIDENASPDDATSPVEVLRAMRTFLRSDGNTGFDETRLQEATLPDLRSVWLYSYSTSEANRSGLFVIVDLGDGTFGFANAQFPTTNETSAHNALLGLVTGFVSTSAESLICTISTEQLNTVQLRIGPGTNRTVITFLPASREFTVLGQTTIGDAVWLKLDKQEIAPQSAAAELWVAIADVTASSGCDSVGTAEPPPIIRIVVDPPRVGDDSSGADTADSPFDPLCPGGTSAEFVAVMWNTTDMNVLSACMSNVLYWEREARAQQSVRRAEVGVCDINHGPRPEERNVYFASYWALTDVGTAYYIMGTRYAAVGQSALSRQSFSTLANNYYCGWAWDPQGWFWWLANGLR